MQSSSQIPPYFQPATLPEALLELHEALVQSGGGPARRQAALDIIREYFKFFGPTGVRPEMWRLLAGALSAKHIPGLKKGVERQNLLFFYEFTLMMVDAVGVISDELGEMSDG